MDNKEQLSIQNPVETAQSHRDKVAHREYAGGSEMSSRGLLSFTARNHRENTWLVDEVVPAYDALRTNPERAVSISKVRNALAAEQAKCLFTKDEECYL